jgi:hypothetical protein
MLAIVRRALQVVVFFLLLSAVVGIGSGDTGALEKVVLVALGVALVWAAPLVRRIGARSTPRPG